MNTDGVKREDWVVGGLAVLLVIDLVELPWHTVAGGMISGISFPSISDRATGPPDGLLGVLAVFATLAIVFDLLLEHLSPDTQIPSIKGSRTLTRVALAITAAGLLALKFILHLTQIGDLGSGFWFGAVVTAALLYATLKAWEANPVPPADAGNARTRPNEDAAAADGPADTTDAREESNEPDDRGQPTEAPEASAQSES